MYNPYDHTSRNGPPPQGNGPYGAGSPGYQGYYIPVQDQYGQHRYMRFYRPGEVPLDIQQQIPAPVPRLGIPYNPDGWQIHGPPRYPSHEGGYPPGGNPGFSRSGQGVPMNYASDRGNIPDQQQQYEQQRFSAPHYDTQSQQPTQTPPAGAGTVSKDHHKSNHSGPQQPKQQGESAAYYTAQPQPVQAAPAERSPGSSVLGQLSAAGGRLLGNNRDKSSMPQKPMQHDESTVNSTTQLQQPMQAVPGAERERGLASSVLGATGGGFLGSRLGAGMVGTAGGALAGAAGMNMAHKLHQRHHRRNHYYRRSGSSCSSSSSSSSSCSS